MANYWPRFAERAVLAALADMPVVMLEGARAVGKTSLCRELASKGALGVIADLSVPETLAAAQRDPERWVRTLSVPAVVDEAQLLPELTTAVKRVVDERGEAAQFLLTGSAQIGRAGLGGSDPLAGRAQRVTLRPLTSAERRGAGTGDIVSLVDTLFDSPLPEHHTFEAISSRGLLADIRAGGIPGISLSRGRRTERQLRDVVEAYLEAVLYMEVPGEAFDLMRAKRLLRAVLSTPGGLLNMSKLGSDTGLSRPTVERYAALFETRFLVTRLPALRADAQGVQRAHPKMHGYDTALSAAMTGGASRTSDPTAAAFGPLLENHVVNDLLADAAWSRVRPNVGYWRDRGSTGGREVDVVLTDQTSRMVGVEVKSGTRVRSRDVAGLRALQERSDLHRGFVVYLGDELRRLDDGIWALPIQAFYEPSAMAAPTRPVAPTGASARQTPARENLVTGALHDREAALFLSYVRADDDAEGGRIKAFAQKLADRYAFNYGEQLDVFLDKQIGWGEQWRERIAEELQRTTFLVAIVTPAFLNSQACRDEVLEFMTAARRLGHEDLLLPILWRRPPDLDRLVEEGDTVARALAETQWVVWEEHRYQDPDSGALNRAVDELAARLFQASRSLSASPIMQAAEGSVAEPEELVDALERIESAIEALPDDMEAFGSAFERLSPAMESTGGPPPGGSAKGLRAWARRFADAVEPARANLDEATRRLRERWASLDEGIGVLLRFIAEQPLLAAEPSTRELLDSIEALPAELASTFPETELADTEQLVALMSSFSRHLRPISESVGQGLTVFRDMVTSSRAWAEAAHSARDSPAREDD